MKNLNYKMLGVYSILMMVILALQSCYDDSLNLLPEDEISDGSFWKNPTDFELAANNFYQELQGWRPSDEDSDIMTPTTSVNDVSNGSYIATENSNVWNNAYSRIRGHNYLIERANQYTGKDASQIARFEAEAKFFRAYAYFDLLKDFGGVPLILHPLDISSEELNQQRASRDEVVDQILDDLDFAISQLPVESAIADPAKGRISKQGAQGFKARVALFEGTWQKFRGNTSRANTLLSSAVAAADDVITSNEYELFSALGDSSYRYLFIVDDNMIAKSNPLGLDKSAINEYVIKRKYSLALDVTHGTTHSLLQYSCPTKKMADMYLCEDGLPIDKSPLFEGRDMIVSEYQNRDLRMTQSIRVAGKTFYSYGSFGRDFDNPDDPGFGIGPHVPNFGENTSTGYSTLKFSAEKRGITAGQEETDYPVLRYSEILLIYAEALFEKDESISDADLNRSINVVRERVNLPALTNSFVSSNGLNMREEIRRERTVELFMEGFRLDDLKRWKTAEIEMPMALRGVKMAGTEYESDPFYADLSVDDRLDSEGFYVWVSSGDRQFLDKHYLFPLPTEQVAMMGIKQNPGW